MIKIACYSAAAFALLFSPLSRAEPAPQTASPARTTASPARTPMKTCVVSGDELGGDMGEVTKIDYKGRTVILCCKSCIKKFNKDPKKYIKKLDEAQAIQKK